MTSLIRQRMELDRQRRSARSQLGLAVVWVLLGALMFGSDRNSWLPWVYVGLALLTGLVGWRQLMSARRALDAFEAEHGPGAGVQNPLR
jgi:hypothetical protein